MTPKATVPAQAETHAATRPPGSAPGSENSA